ncbi:uncharacterized protein LOC143299745 [Babylonia areolata]|uniref:uncharacterized protein LOC143299745 n=1 Tax=Babylonia areolata TaxID=304850 RepID=UPI003FD16314
MWFFAAVVASLLGAVICRPPIVTPYGNFSTEPVSQEYRDWLEKNTPTHRASYPPGFKFMYFSQDGRIAPNSKPSGNFIRIVGSPQTSESTLYVAALELHKMMKNSPSHVFNNVANSPGGVGIFTAAESVTVFPDFAHLADTPACRNRCDGSCSHTCTFDGRKLSSLSGVTSTLSLVLDANVMCTSRDPYNHRDNIMMHEFSHMVNKQGMSSSEKAQNDANYNNAKSQNLWNLQTYAMANSAEYFAESTGAFFLVNMQTGGMTDCSYGECRTEMDARQHLRSRDYNLYNFLAHIWTNGRGDLSSGIKTCYGH